MGGLYNRYVWLGTGQVEVDCQHCLVWLADIKWSDLEVEGVCCRGKDIYIAARERIYKFHDLRLSKSFRSGGICYC